MSPDPSYPRSVRSTAPPIPGLGIDLLRRTPARSPGWRTPALAALATLALVAFSAVPYLRLPAPPEPADNEGEVLTFLRHLAWAESQVQSVVYYDIDRNGDGEYANFHELANCTRLLRSHTLYGGGEAECIERFGYLFEIHLSHNVRVREREWVCYAWPLEQGRTGGRAYVVDQGGEILVHANEKGRYSGTQRRPERNAALRAAPAGSVRRWTLATNGAGADGLRWELADPGPGPGPGAQEADDSQ